MTDLSAVNVELNKDDVPKVEGLLEAFTELIEVCYSKYTLKNLKRKSAKQVLKEEKLLEENINQLIVNLVNTNVKIGTKKEFLLESFSEAEKEIFLLTFLRKKVREEK